MRNTMQFTVLKTNVAETPTDEKGEVAQWAAQHAPCSIRIEGEGMPHDAGDVGLLVTIAEGETVERIIKRIDILVTHFTGLPPKV